MKCGNKRLETGESAVREGKEQTVIEKTCLYLRNYREMERYIKEAVSEASQVPDAGKYNISAERAYIKSIRESKAETVILYNHMKKSLTSLKKDARAAGEGYKYQAFYMHHIEGMSYADVARKMECGKNTPKRWCKEMVKKYSVKLFGAKAIEK